MNKAFYFRCPTCETLREVKINKRDKPFLRCNFCGALYFWNRPEGIRRLRERVVDSPDSEGGEVRP
jgi:uncharacterized Zn finger protein